MFVNVSSLTKYLVCFKMSIFKKIEVGMFVIFKVRFWNFGQVLLKTVGKIISIPDQKSAIVVTIDGKYYTTFHIVKIVPEAVPLYAINDMVHTKEQPLQPLMANIILDVTKQII